jgi:microcin C transport system substrate-binding protein
MPALVDSAKKAGLELTAEALEKTTLFKQIKVKAFEIAYSGWSLSAERPNFRQFFHGENARNPDGSLRLDTNNIVSLSDPELDALIDRESTVHDTAALVELSRKTQRRLHDLAVFIPNQATTGYRMARWRWVRFPEHFDAKCSGSPFEFMLFWLDEDLRRETESARKTGRSFGKKTTIHEQFRPE